MVIIKRGQTMQTFIGNIVRDDYEIGNKTKEETLRVKHVPAR
jgi:hypothetical protein